LGEKIPGSAVLRGNSEVILRNTTPVLGLHRPQFADLVLLAAQCVFIIVLPTSNKDYLESHIIPILLSNQEFFGDPRIGACAREIDPDTL
jgi:hypothetical protein